MAGENQPGGRDPLLEQLFVAALLAGGAALAAWYWSDALLTAGAAAALVVLRLPAMLAGHVDLPFVSDWLLRPAAKHVEILERTPAASLRSGEVLAALGVAGRTLLPVLLPLALLAALSGIRIRPDRVYRRQHTLDSMVGEQSRQWSAARFAVLVDPSRSTDTVIEPPEDMVMAPGSARPRGPAAAGEPGIAAAQPAVSELLPETPPDQPPGAWMRSLRPEEWLAARGIAITESGVDLDLVVEALSRQLRRQWTGPASLSPPESGILAVLMLFHARRTREAESLTDHLATLFAEQVAPRLTDDPFPEPMTGMAAGAGAALMVEAMAADGLERRIRKVTETPALAEPLLKAEAGHWFVETALPSLWVAGRRGRGILAPARFVWLRTVNRAVWYAISSAGGHVAPVEAAGIIAHMRAEDQLGMPLALPRVRKAARALVDDYLDLSDERRALRRTHAGEV